MFTVNVFKNASIVFASNHVAIAEMWGTTDRPYERPRPGAILVVAGNEARLPCVLLKTHDKTICVIQTLSPEDLFKPPIPATPGITLRAADTSFAVWFPDGEAWWAFHSLVDRAPMWQQLSLIAEDDVRTAWLNFNIPVEFPPKMKPFQYGIFESYDRPIKIEPISPVLSPFLPVAESPSRSPGVYTILGSPNLSSIADVSLPNGQTPTPTPTPSHPPIQYQFPRLPLGQEKRGRDEVEAEGGRQRKRPSKK